KEKHLHRVQGTLTLNGESITGYEIHAGFSSGDGLSRPLIKLDQRNDGAISADNQVSGTYLHGLFDDDGARTALLQWAGLKSVDNFDYHAKREADIDRLADTCTQYLDWARLDALLIDR